MKRATNIEDKLKSFTIDMVTATAGHLSWCVNAFSEEKARKAAQLACKRVTGHDGKIEYVSAPGEYDEMLDTVA